MFLNLSRVDYLHVGSTSRKSMCLLPVTQYDLTNHIVVGDQSGTLSIFAMRERNPQLVAKTKSDAKITRVELGAPEDHVRNRIFYAAGTGIRGLTKKGKEFLYFNTNLCEDIRSMCIDGVDLCVCGNFTCLQYKDLRDEKFAALSDMIHDVVYLPRTEHRADVRPVVACDDRSIRVLSEASAVVSVEAIGIPQVLRSFDDGKSPERDEVLYGTADGKLGFVCLKDSVDAPPKHLWEQSNDNRAGAVTSLDLFDVVGDGVNQLIVGREDGLVELHAFLEDGKPEKRFSHRLADSVTTVCGGFVAIPKFAEIVCCTFSGMVSALTTEPLRPVRSLGEAPDPSIVDSVQKKLEGLKAEMHELRTRLEIEKQKPRKPFCEEEACAVPLNVNDSFRLDPSDASYLLAIEAPTGIEYVLLQSDVSLELAKSDSSPTTIVSFTKSCDNLFLATFRCELDNTTRLDIRLRTIEGAYGTLRAYVCPRRVYPKMTKLLQYDIRPLSLHQRTTAFDDKRPLNFLQMTGNYSLAEVHSWLSFCLPGLPDKSPADGKMVSYSFVSTLLNTVVQCTCARGQGSIRSDNLTTIMTLSDVMTREATKKKISLNIRCTIDENSIPHTVRLIHQALREQLDLARKVQVVEALLDLTAGEEDTSYLTRSNQALLKDADRLIKEHRTKSFTVGRLNDSIVSLFVDSCRFKGRHFKPRLSALKAMLSSGSFSLQEVEDFFTNIGADSTA